MPKNQNEGMSIYVTCRACGSLFDSLFPAHSLSYCPECQVSGQAAYDVVNSTGYMSVTRAMEPPTPCERCGEQSNDRAYATTGDWNSPLWCLACRSLTEGE